MSKIPKIKGIVFIISFAILSFLILTLYFFSQEFRNERLPFVGRVHDFELVDSNNNPFTLNHLKGRVWIADFFFTTCGDICPIMNKNMAALSRSYQKVKGIHLVSISVNPEFDTPEVLREYEKKLDVNRSHWHFLTGDRKSIKDLAVNSFKLGKIDEPVFHSSYFTLVDRNGLIRGYYDGTKQENINTLFKDAAQLLKSR